MTKWADFVISAFKKGSGLSNITHVQIHEDLEHGLTAPKLINKHELSSKIQKGTSFITIFKKNSEIGYKVVTNISHKLIDDLLVTNNQVLKLTTAFSLMLDE
jgi:hypothetical protein